MKFIAPRIGRLFVALVLLPLALPAQAKPVATFTSICVPLTCLVDASASTGAAGYRIKWGDSTQTPIQSRPYATHQYTKPGVYDVVLTTFGPSMLATAGLVGIKKSLVVPAFSVHDTVTVRDTMAFIVTLPTTRMFGCGVLVDSAASWHPRGVWVVRYLGPVQQDAAGKFLPFRFPGTSTQVPGSGMTIGFLYPAIGKYSTLDSAVTAIGIPSLVCGP